MRFTRSLLVVVCFAPAALSAQVPVPSPPRPVRVPDLSWLAPMVADAQVHAATALARVAPAMARARIGLAGVGPAMAQARVGLAHARAALATTPFLRGFAPAMAVVLGGDFDELDQTPPAPWAQQDPADQLYRDARAALNRERYTTAADLFAQIYTKYPRSSYAGDAYYWQAYALSKRGTDESLKRALAVLRLQTEKAPQAGTSREAQTLITRIEGQLARAGDARAAASISATASTAVVAVVPGPAAPVAPAMRSTPARAGRHSRDRCESEDDIQTAALNALQQMDADKALPILKKVLARRDSSSLCLRRKAIFIVSQSEGPEAERILLEAARSDPDQEVREQAVQWLSQVDSPGAVAALDSILRSATDPALQEKAIFALSQQESSKARQALRDFALRAGVPDELREKAIFWIGQGDDPDRQAFLKTLYGQLKGEAIREKILFSMSQIEGKETSQWLLQVAADVNENIELRKKALFWVGQSDYPLSELSTLYDRMPSHEMKEQLIFVYSQRSEKAAVDRLMQIARTETDKELRKKAIFWLSQSNDPRVPEFLASLLEKP